MRRNNSDGFTVLELLIAMMILALIIGPLFSSLVLGLARTTTSAQDTANSSDAQTFSSVWNTDVASADTINHGTTCGGADTALQFEWTDGATTKRAAYIINRNASAEAEFNRAPLYRLQRVTCTGATTDTVTVVRAMSSSTGIFACDGTADCPNGQTPTPRTVSATVSDIGGQAGDTAYNFTVTATRRVNP